MKHLFFTVLTAVAVLTTLSFAGCKNGQNGQEPDLPAESTWSKAVKEHPFLAHFPKYDYDYQGTYQKVVGVEMYQVTDWSGSEQKFKEYRDKLEKENFTLDSELSEKAVNYIKTGETGETLEAYITLTNLALNINLSSQPKDW